MPKIKEIIDLSFPRFFRYFAWHSVISDQMRLVLVAEVEGKLSGFAKLIEFNIGVAKYGCILWIAVHPAYRRRGIALSLTKAGVDCLKNRWFRSSFCFYSEEEIRRRLLLWVRQGLGGWVLWVYGDFLGGECFSFYRDYLVCAGEVVLMRDLLVG